MKTAAARVGEDIPGDGAAVIDHAAEGFLQLLVQQDDKGATGGKRRAFVGAGKASGDPSIGKGRVIGAVIRERPAEHGLEECLRFDEIGGLELDVVYLVALVHGGGN